MDHLTEDTRAVLPLSQEDRINYLYRPKWIGYPRATMIQEMMAELLKYDPQPRIPNMLVVGPSNNGKTHLATRFMQYYPTEFDEEAGVVRRPLLSIVAPASANEGLFFEKILNALGTPYNSSSRVSQRVSQALRMMKFVGVRMLIVDEIQQLIAGTAAQQRVLLNHLKNLGTELQIPIVGIGTEESYTAMSSDPQLSNRFVPETMPLWELEDDDYMQLLSSFESLLPLHHPSNLTSDNLAERIFHMSDGLLGEISRLLLLAAVAAIRSGQERITEELLQEIRWNDPSTRNISHRFLRQAPSR